MTAVQSHPVTPRPQAVALGGGLLGFAFGGFFDGILLHQVFQWHHLLSAVESDLWLLVLADGLFHAAMYLLAMAGLLTLWLSRTALAAEGAGRLLVSWFLIGFGGWHLIDAILVHWILGLHHIRMDLEDWLFWDLVFFAIGLAFLAAGWAAHRTLPARPAIPASVLAAITVGAGLAAALPSGGERTTVVFAPWVGGDAAAAAIAASGAAIVDARVDQGIWSVTGLRAPDALPLYARGALYVSSTPLAAGCFSGALPRSL